MTTMTQHEENKRRAYQAAWQFRRMRADGAPHTPETVALIREGLALQIAALDNASEPDEAVEAANDIAHAWNTGLTIAYTDKLAEKQAMTR